MAEMMKKRNVLFDSFDLRGINLKNRIAIAPMTRSRAGEEHMPNSLMA
jgi:N-ethylmaleimide reductase